MEKLKNMIFNKTIEYREVYFYYILCILSILMGIFYLKASATPRFDIVPHSTAAMTIFEHGVSFQGPGQVLSYPIYHLCQKFIAKMASIDYITSAAFLLALSSVLTIIIYRWGVNKILQPVNILHKYLFDAICLMSVIFENASGFLTQGRLYARQAAPNPLHNPTVLFVRPSGILVFFIFVIMLKKLLEHKKCTKEMILYVGLLIFSSLIKPSYVFVLLPAFAIATLICIIYKKQWSFAIKIFLLTLPVVVLMLIQAGISFPTEADFQTVANAAGQVNAAVNLQPISRDEMGIIYIQFGSFSHFTLQEVIYVSIAAFPIPLISVIVFGIIKRKQYKEMPIYWISILVLIASWMEMFFLSNGLTGDFSWGYMLGVNLVTVISLCYLIRFDVSRWIKGASLAIYLYQIVCGLYYYRYIYMMGEYWI